MTGSTAVSWPRGWGSGGIVVAAGDALGEPGHVRITLPVVAPWGG